MGGPDGELIALGVVAALLNVTSVVYAAAVIRRGTRRERWQAVPTILASTLLSAAFWLIVYDIGRR